MPRDRSIASFVLLLLAVLLAPATAQEPLRVGVTLRPYFSWVAGIAGDQVEIVPIAGREDLRAIAGLDAIVVNGIGHDDAVLALIEAAGNDDLVVIRPNRGLALIPVGGRGSHHGEGNSEGDRAVNSHTFLSVESAIVQIRTIERELSALSPDRAAAFRAGARATIRRIRALRSDALNRLGPDFVPPPVATLHDGYAYFFQELVFEVAVVLEPAHGVPPSAAEMAAVAATIRERGVVCIFSEPDTSPALVETIRAETGIDVVALDSISTGDWSADRYEMAMAHNFAVLVERFGPKNDE